MFQRVSTQLEQVHQGLWENAWSCGRCWGLKERFFLALRLAELLEKSQLGAGSKRHFLQQYEENVATVSGSTERVEFAVVAWRVRETVWLPIDSKSPGDTARHLVDAINAGNEEAIAAAKKGLTSELRQRQDSLWPVYCPTRDN